MKGTNKISEERKDEIIRGLLGEWMEGITEYGLEIVRSIMTDEELKAYGYDLDEQEKNI